MDRDWSAAFESTFSGPVSIVDRRIWREVFGDEYPEGVDPHSYISRTELGQFIEATGVQPGDLLADVGCGRGGPGLWVAAHTGANLIGVDLAHSAASSAKDRSTTLDLPAAASFTCGTFDHLPLATASVDAVMSVDALLFAPDKMAAVVELARVVRPGGRLVFTTWDYHSQPAGRPPQVADHRPLLVSAGFEVLAYDETVDWRERQRRTDELAFAALDELAAEGGVEPNELRADLEEQARTADAMLRRVLAVAQRR